VREEFFEPFLDSECSARALHRSLVRDRDGAAISGNLRVKRVATVVWEHHAKRHSHPRRAPFDLIASIANARLVAIRDERKMKLWRDARRPLSSTVDDADRHRLSQRASSFA
jgi:hypothetical protein